MTEPVRRLLAFECARAREFYQRAILARPDEDRRRLVAAEIMRAVYFETLRRIERNGYDVFTGRVRVPRPMQALIALRQWLWPSLTLNSDRSLRRRGDRRRIRRLERGRASGRERGARVLVLEARARLGGRATAFADRETGELVDNGQHVLLGCYTETLAFLRRHRRDRATSAWSRS